MDAYGSMLSTLPEKKNLGTTGVRGHTFMTPKKMTNFVTYLYFHVQKRVTNLLFNCLKTIESTNM